MRPRPYRRPLSMRGYKRLTLPSARDLLARSISELLERPVRITDADAEGVFHIQVLNAEVRDQKRLLLMLAEHPPRDMEEVLGWKSTLDFFTIKETAEHFPDLTQQAPEKGK